MKNRSIGLQIGFTVIPILISLAVAALMVMAFGRNPTEVFQLVWQGAFNDPQRFAGVLNFWIPLMLCAMGLVITFTAGLWNIGVEGQITMGALFSSGMALYINLPEPYTVLQIPLQVLLGALGGALWALLVGVLKTRLGVHEIFGGVALNSIALVLAIHMITGPWAPAEGSNAQSTAPFPPSNWLPTISDDFPVNLMYLIIAAAVVVVIVLALRGTRWGLNLKATGKNPRSALLLGVPTQRTSLTAFMACGALAGMAGAYRVLFTYQSMRPLASGGIGFLALLVVLLVDNRALLVPFVAFAFAAILAGSTRLKVALQLDQSLAGVLQGTLVLLVLLFSGLRTRIMERREAAALLSTDSNIETDFRTPSSPLVTDAVEMKAVNTEAPSFE
ncbi:MAG: ABC transporter permease [Burkholderiales bacterium]|nr:ABC transporter permease [Anaerolineae bacterium]